VLHVAFWGGSVKRQGGVGGGVRNCEGAGDDLKGLRFAPDADVWDSHLFSAAKVIVEIGLTST
jgi:hypothetical protein